MIILQPYKNTEKGVTLSQNQPQEFVLPLNSHQIPLLCYT